MNAADMRVNKTLMRREFWENRSLWLVPSVVAGVLTVLTLYMLVAVLVGHSNTVNNVDIANGPHFQLDNMPDLRDASDTEITGLVRIMTGGLGAIFNIIMQIVVFFYLLDSLYADRRDRSVLFWRSMPVSDTRTVLSKLATALFALTAVTFAVTVAFQLVLVVLELIMGSVLGVHPFVLLAHPGAFLGAWLLLAYGLIVQAVWMLPFYGWFMLASSWAKKTPFLWAVLVPLGIIGAEGWVFHSFRFGRMIFAHRLDWLGLAYNFDPTSFRGEQGAEFMGGSIFGIGNIGQLLASPELWIGTVLAAGFIYGAIWLRRLRTEI